MTQSGEQASGPAADLARQGAERARDFASWLEQREPGDLLEEVKTFARQRPGMFLLVAAGVGLVAGRMTRGLKETASDEAEASQRRGAYGEYGTPTRYGTGGHYGSGTQYGTGAQYGTGEQYGAGTQYDTGEQYGTGEEGSGTVVLGTVDEIEVVRPYASSEDGGTGFPTGGTTGGTR